MASERETWGIWDVYLTSNTVGTSGDSHTHSLFCVRIHESADGCVCFAELQYSLLGEGVQIGGVPGTHDCVLRQTSSDRNLWNVAPVGVCHLPPCF